MRAILVAVDYSDYLQYTLPYNRHHFDDVMVVTTPLDSGAIRIAEENHCKVFCTNAFYDDGADFNKWKALESALDTYGRYGWLCLMDADVLWPKKIDHQVYQTGFLYGPLRRMLREVQYPFPPESEWRKYQVHRNVNEWAGYTQIFHADDPHLPAPPWHEINWRHAGGADSFFQRLWPASNKIRTPWEVLHLGASGCNWCGRATDYLGGGKPEDGSQRMDQVRKYVASRRRSRPDPYADERVG